MHASPVTQVNLLSTTTREIAALRQSSKLITPGDYGVFLVAGQSAGRVPAAGSQAGYHDSDEQASQLIFGDPYKIIAVASDSKSILVQSAGASPNDFWIEAHKHTKISAETYSHIISNRQTAPCLQIPQFAIPNDHKAEGVIWLPPGSNLLFYNPSNQTFLGASGVYKLSTPPQNSIFTSNDPTKENLLKALISQLGWPYDWGGNGFGVDCSGFTKRIYDQFLLEDKLPRNVREQKLIGASIADRDVRTGDLIHYTRHVGIFVSADDIRRYNRSGLVFPAGRDCLFHSKQFTRVEGLEQPGWRTENMNPSQLFTGIQRIIDFQD